MDYGQEIHILETLDSIASSLASIAKSLKTLRDISKAIGPADGQSFDSIIDQLQILNTIQNK